MTCGTTCVAAHELKRLISRQEEVTEDGRRTGFDKQFEVSSVELSSIQQLHIYNTYVNVHIKYNLIFSLLFVFNCIEHSFGISK